MINTILFPSDFFNKKKIDEDLQQEYFAAKSVGLFKIILFGYPDWFHEERLILTEKPDKMTSAIYRGWMMKPETYEKFYKKLLENKIQLITTPKEYELFHLFPNIYPKLIKDTAQIMVYPKNRTIDIEKVKKTFPQFMVKDYVKSVKGTDFPCYFNQDITQEQFDHWMNVFYQYRGTLFTGGICIKEYLKLKRYHSKTNEYRVFYIHHEIATISRNSGQSLYTPLPPRKLLEKYQFLESNFYTIDYAELTDGTWKIIEAGDGSVSGLSENQDYEAFFRAFYRCFQ